MRTVSLVMALLAVVAGLISSVHAISKVTRAGRYLYDDSGNRFYIKGVAYQEMCMSRLSSACLTLLNHHDRSRTQRC